MPRSRKPPVLDESPALPPTPELVPITEPPVLALPMPVPPERPMPQQRGTVQGMVETNDAVRRMILILMNGRDHPLEFPPHSGLLSQLRRALFTQNEELFLTTLRHYLTQATFRLTQVPRPEQIEPLLSEIERLMKEECGIVPVARHILAGFA